ncbi:MAG TPA: hypothetical protein VF777_01550 [Phycisphaerales bacterium]
MQISIDQAMLLLEYDRRWLEVGFVTPEVVVRQATEHAETALSTEHFRWRSFTSLLTDRNSWLDSEVATLATLIEVDPDPCMAEATLQHLVLRKPWTDAQFELLAATVGRRFPKTFAVLWEYQVERALAASQSQREAAEAALRCTLSFVQFTALDVIEERQWIDLAQRLADTGISKEIRHHARQIVRQIRQSQSPDTPKA